MKHHRRLVKVFHVRYERDGAVLDHVVVSTSEIRALEAVIGLHHEFTSKDTLNAARARYGCNVTASPWKGEVPTIVNVIGGTS